MLTNTQNRAVNMMFDSTEEEVARQLRIRKETLDLWKDNPDFTRKLSMKQRENRESARRILSRICVDACRELESLIKSDDSKDKPKAIIEVLKASGIFKELGAEEVDGMSELLGRLADESEDIESGEED
ncbi:MAG: hypothetical protein ACYC27_12885 [Armatimonadota bacterium]